jgi:hypothetical protein
MSSELDPDETRLHQKTFNKFFSLFSLPQVFHVCALTDDGLIMKSFLCPESTLFDQTILKCNWWFYTDCKSSKSLYDSNLPVSKSYQLMKSISYFNKNYKSSTNSTADASPKNDDKIEKSQLSPLANHNLNFVTPDAAQ